MRQIKAQPITIESFAPFGQFYSMDKPQGFALEGAIHRFFPDRLVADCNTRVGYSVIQVTKPDKLVITQQEYHTATWEMIMPLNDDMIFHVSPASGGEPSIDHAKVFIVPKNTMIKLNTAVWHLAPLPVNGKELTCLIVLPERTYANDLTVADLTPDQQFEIVL